MQVGIKSRSQYERYLREYEAVRDSEPQKGSPEWGKMLLMGAIIESYETGYEEGLENSGLPEGWKLSKANEPKRP